MAIFHLSVKTISRSKGQSATAASAYRAGDKIVDRTTGAINNYQKKSGVLHSEIVGCDLSRTELWNMAEEAETRVNSTVAREFEIALPAELPFEEQKALAMVFARELVEKHKFVADVAIHAPSKGGDNRNVHAHILCTTRRWDGERLGEKTRELDTKNSGEVDYWRNRWEELQRERGIDVSAKTLAEQGIERIPEPHFGKDATHWERKTGEKSEIRKRHEAAQEPKLTENSPEIEEIIAKNVQKYVKQSRVTAEVLDSFRDVQPFEMLDWLDCYHKTYTEGSNTWTHISHAGREFDIIIDEKTQRWNDKHTGRLEGEPRRIGAVSLLMHIEKIGFKQACERLGKMQQDRENLREIEQEPSRGMSR